MQDFLPIGILILITVLLVVFVSVMSRLFGPFRPTRRKQMPYESGVDPIGPAIRRLPIKFYLTAVLFILFDIEVVFFLPWAVVMRRMGLFGLFEMLIFTAILLAGYVYAWRKGALQWE